MNCKNCGNEVDKKAVVCPNCGVPIKKRKLFPIIISLVVLIVIISALSSNGDNSNTSTSGSGANQQSSLTPAPATNSAVNRIDIPNDGIVIFDSDGIIIKAESIKRERSGQITGIDLLITNNSEKEKNVCVWPDAAFGGPIIVNGYSMNSTFNEKVAAGKMSKATLRFDSNTIKLLEFENLYELVAPFGTYESRNDYLKHEITTYSPSVLKLADFTAIPMGELTYNEKGIEIYICDFKGSALFSDKAVYVIKNNLGKDRTLELDSVSINGLMLDSFLNESADVFNDTFSVIFLPLRYDDGNKYTKENVKEIEFTIKSKEFNSIFSMDTETIGVVTISY